MGKIYRKYGTTYNNKVFVFQKNFVGPINNPIGP